MCASKVTSSKESVTADSAASISIVKPRMKLPSFKSFSEPRISSRGLVGRVVFYQSEEKTPKLETPDENKSVSSSSSIDWTQCVTPSPSREADVELEQMAVDAMLDQIGDLDNFLNAFLDLSKTETEEMSREITIQFSNLDIKNQRLMRNSIERILIKYGPGFTPEELEETVDQVIRNPFIEIEDETDWKNNIVVMSTAIIEARRILQRVMDKFEQRGTSMAEVTKVAKSLDFDGIDVKT